MGPSDERLPQANEVLHPIVWSASTTRETCIFHQYSTNLRPEDDACPAVERVPPSDAKDHPPMRCNGDGGRRASSNRMNVIIHVEEQDRSTVCSASIESMRSIVRPTTCFSRAEE